MGSVEDSRTLLYRIAAPAFSANGPALVRPAVFATAMESRRPTRTAPLDGGPHRPQDDVSLLAKLADGPPRAAASERFVRRYGPRILQWCCRLGPASGRRRRRDAERAAPDGPADRAIPARPGRQLPRLAAAGRSRRLLRLPRAPAGVAPAGRRHRRVRTLDSRAARDDLLMHLVDEYDLELAAAMKRVKSRVQPAPRLLKWGRHPSAAALWLVGVAPVGAGLVGWAYHTSALNDALEYASRKSGGRRRRPWKRSARPPPAPARARRLERRPPRIPLHAQAGRFRRRPQVLAATGASVRDGRPGRGGRGRTLPSPAVTG